MWHKNRALWAILGTGSVPTTLYIYDTFECGKIRKKYLDIAEKYGQVPLPIQQKPMTLVVLAEGKSRDELAYQYDMFQSMIQPFWTSAGIEYEWIEASQTKHAVEAVKLYKDRQQAKDYSKEDIIEEPEHLPWKSQESSMPLFKNLTEWRLASLLEKHTEEIQQCRIPLSENSSFWTRLWGSPAPKTECIVHSVKLKSSDNELAETVKSSLLPIHLDVGMYQHGVVGADAHVFKQILSVYRRYLYAFPRVFSDTFGPYPFRVGFIPFRESSGFLERMYFRFFNKRQDMASMAAFALGFITETQELWSDRLEEIYPPDDPDMKGLLNGRILLVKPVSLESQLGL